MKPLQRAAFDHHGRSPEERTRRIQAMSKQVYGSEVSYEKADEIRKGVEEGEVWLNDVYQVSVQDRGDFVWVLFSARGDKHYVKVPLHAG